MPLIVYAGHTPTVSVPGHNLAEVEHGVPVDVPAHVADDLTAGGTSRVWLYVDAAGDPPTDAPDGGDHGDDENTED